MKNVLVIGAGRSSGALIHYLLQHAEAMDAVITVADQSLELAQQKVDGHARGRAVALNVADEAARQSLVKASDLVVSLLPADLHPVAARDCLLFHKHLVTASYVSKEMQALDSEARAKGLLFLNEIGVDPGIDHMSAMQVIHRIQQSGATLTGFWSYCGGLIAPESNNRWGYKFTWAPRNVILAGQATAVFLENGRIRYRNYGRMFSEITEIEVPGHGRYEAYANRDSIKYLPLYGLTGIHTLFRGTLRFPGYCALWNAFVKLGLTDDTLVMNGSEHLSMQDYLLAFFPMQAEKTVQESLAAFLGVPVDGEVMDKIAALGFFTEEKPGLSGATPARMLQHILETKWVLEENDIDLLVMQHQFEYELGGQKHRLLSSMVDKGHDHTMTAMARTVGLPMAIASRLILEGRISQRGVIIPIHPEIYNPILAELQQFGIHFTEHESAC